MCTLVVAAAAKKRAIFALEHTTPNGILSSPHSRSIGGGGRLLVIDFSWRCLQTRWEGGKDECTQIDLSPTAAGRLAKFVIIARDHAQSYTNECVWLKRVEVF